MIISSKHIQTNEEDIYGKLCALFSDSPHFEVAALQSDLFDSICGPRKLLGKKIAEYPDKSISFFIALIKEGEGAPVINRQKEIEEVPAPDGSEYFNQVAVINISNDTIYYATIDRFSEYDIKYFIKQALNISENIEFENIADEKALKKIARFGVNGIDLNLVYNQSYIDNMRTKSENPITAAARDFMTYICGSHDKLCDANYSNGLKTKFSINRTSLPKKDKKANKEQQVNYSDEALKKMATDLCSETNLGNDIKFQIRLKNGGGKITASSLFLARDFSINRSKLSYNEMLLQINAAILKFKEQNREYLLSLKE